MADLCNKAGQSFQVGANAGEVIGVNLPSLQAPNLGAYGWPLQQSPTTNSYAINRGNDEIVPAGDLVLRDKPIAIERNESMASIAQKINDAGFDPKIYAQASTSALLAINTTLPPGASGSLLGGNQQFEDVFTSPLGS
ncbi:MULTISPECIES: hypothetical protein [Comamonas]|uniref:hypothetical protein n=1 Tax=Comamonas TaxID=283 RepID=UPI000682D0A8|nr:MULTISPECIES: hypothetical protein [Comamonas]MCO8251642.1 hypothetical protein [Comamonas thiooxydans]